MTDLLQLARTPRRTIQTKRELTDWCRENGIALTAPIKQARGWFHIVVALPPAAPRDERSTGYTYSVTIGGGDTGREPWSFEPYRYLPGTTQRVPVSDEARALDEARVARLNEIQKLVDTLRNVSIKY